MVDSAVYGVVEEPTELDFWLRYIKTFRSLDLYKAKRLIPTIYSWDDHDYGANNGDRGFAMRQISLAVFNAFWGTRNIDGVFERSGYGTSSRLLAFGQQFFITNPRYFRKKRLSNNSYAHWGKDQHNWIFENARKNQGSNLDIQRRSDIS